MKFINIKFAYYSVFFLIFMSGCQKVINVNLNSSSPQYVIEANVVDSQMSQVVQITRSLNFNQDNLYPTVDNAIVVITDNSIGLTDTLLNFNPGNYITTRITGVSGHQYSLYISVGGHIFTATSTMPDR